MSKELQYLMAGRQFTHTNGSIHTVLFVCNTTTPNKKYPPMVVYVGQNGALWTRLFSDWDRSFTIIEKK